MSGDFVGARVRFFRLHRGLSQRALATLAGLPQGGVSPLEAGLRPVGALSTLVRLAVALDVCVADLTARPDAPGDRGAGASTAAPEIRGALARLAYRDLPEVPSRTLVELHAAVGRLGRARRSGDYAAAAPLVSGLVCDLGSAAYVLTSGRARRASLRLLTVATYHATLLAECLGHVDLALAAAERCHDAAGELGEPVYGGLADRARVRAVPPEHHAVRRRLAAAAVQRLRCGDKPQEQRVYGMLRLTSAGAAASAGDADGAAAHLAEAAQVVRRLGPDPAGAGCAAVEFGPADIARSRVSLALQAEAYATAVELARAVDPADIGSPSRRAAFHIDVGCALAAGRRNDAAALARFADAERTAPQLARVSPMLRDTVGVLLRRARARAGGGQLRALAARVGAG